MNAVLPITRRVASRIGALGVFARQLESLTAAETRTLAVEIERLGFGAIWVPESLTSREIMSQSAILLAATRTIVVATGIANVWARDPVAMANGARALADAYPGRFLLGLGSSQRSIVEARGGNYAHPLTYMRQYLDRMDAAPTTAPRPAEPFCRVVAALGPRMLELARDHADGAYPYFVPVEHTRLARETLGDVALLAVAQAIVMTDGADARDTAVAHCAHYLGRENYRNNLLRLGWSEEHLDAADRSLRDALVPCGDVAIARTIREHRVAGADHVCLHVLGTNGLVELIDALHELRPLAE